MPRWMPFAPALALCAACTPHAPPSPPAATATSTRGTDAAIVVPANSPLRQRLRVEVLQPQPIARPLLAPASIETVPEQRVQILPPLPGRVLRIARALGDTVAVGDVLVELDSAELASVRAEAAKASAGAAQARREQQRMQQLFAADISSRRELEQAQLAQDSADSDARAAAQQLRQLGVAPGGGRRYVLRAPIAGRVIAMEAARGGYWNDINAPLMTVADLSTVWLSAQVAERDLGQVFVGQDASVELSAYPGQPVQGQVRYIGDEVDAQTRAVKVRIAVANPDGRLRPGLFGQVRLLGRPEPALTVPSRALLQDGLSTRVYVEQSAFRFVPRRVQTGAVLGDRVEIVSGLQPGDRVVVQEGALLHD